MLDAAVVLAAFLLAFDLDLDLVVAGGQVADVQALHAALAQRIQFLEAVDVVRNQPAVDAQAHGIEAQRVAVLERDEHRHLRARGVQQFLLEQVEFGGDAQYVGLDLLDLLVEALHLLPVAVLSRPCGTDNEQEQAQQY